MKNIKSRIIIVALIISNIFVIFNYYKLYHSNRINITYIEQKLNKDIYGLKTALDSSLHYINEFIKENKAYFSTIEELERITEYINRKFEELRGLSYNYGLRDDNPNMQMTYRNMLRLTYRGYLLDKDMLESWDDGYVSFNKEQQVYIQELYGLLKEYKDFINKVPDESRLHSEEWVEFVKFYLNR